METRANNRLITTKSAAAKAAFPAAAATVGLRLDCVGLLLALLLVTLCLPASLRAQDVITTIAGNVGGENIAGASFNLPTGVAVDSLGDLYVADTNNCVVWEVTNGVSTVIAGIQGNCTPGAGSGALQSLAHPIDVAFCGSNLYFATHGYDPLLSGQSLSTAIAGGVYEIEISNGTFSTLPMPPTPINSTSPLFPVALACDSNGDVYLASYFYPPSVLPAGSVDEIQAGNPTTKNLIQQAGTVYSGITVDSDGGVFVLSTTGTSVGWLGTTLFGETGFIDRVSNGTTTPAFTVDDGFPNTSRLISNGLGNFLLTIAASDSKPTVIVQAAPGNAVAGNGIANFKDGVQATLGELNSPSGLAVDACGSIYVADSGNNVIRKILNPNTAGTSACASGAPPTGPFPALTASLNIVQGNGQITAPGSVTFYSTEGIQNCTTQCTTALGGEVFFCSFSTASYISATSTDSTPCEGGATLAAVAVSPTSDTSGNASDQAPFLIAGTYYVVAEYFNPPYLPVTTGYVTVTVCGASCTDSGVPNIPVASLPVALTPGALSGNSNGGNGIVALDAKSNEYFLNGSASTVTLVDKNSGGGTIISPSTVLSTGGMLGPMSNPADMVLGADGNLYVTDTGNNRVIQVVNPSTASPTVTVINIGSSGGTLNPPLTAPMGIFETSDEVYVTDMPPSGPRLVAFRPDGSFPTTVLGSAPAGTPPLGQLLGIAVNPTTLAIYVANSEAPGSTSGGSIIKTTIGGTPSVVAMPTTLTLQSPYGLVIDAAGGLYFSDTSTHLVYRLDIHGNVIVVAGNGTATEQIGDSLLAETAVSAVQTGLANPTWLALDTSNSIYILDGSNLLYLDVTQSIVDFTAEGESQTIYVTNPVAGTQGSVEMEFGSPILNGADSGDFSVAAGTTCSQTSSTLLSPNTSCELVLTLNATGNNATATSCTLSEIEVSLGPPLTAGPCNAPPAGLTKQTISLNSIAAPATTLQVTGVAIQGTYNVSYSPVPFLVTGGSGQYTFSETGSLPSGMSLSSAGILLGTPTQGGAFPFTVNVSDSQGDTGSLTQTLVINPAPTMTTLMAPSSLNVSEAFTLTAAVLYNGTPVTSSNVAFYDYNGAMLGLVPLNGSGQASLAATSPATSGTYAYTATFQSTANLATSTGPATIVVSGTANAPVPETIDVTDTPLIVPMPTALTTLGAVAYYSVGSVGFGTVPAGQTATQSFSLSNIGQGQLSLNSAPISGAAFSLSQTLCTNGVSSLPSTLPPAGACVFTISYTAPTGAPANGTITFTDNSPLSNLTSTGSGSTYTQTLALNGSGASSAPGLPPQTTVPANVTETILVTDTPSSTIPTTTTLISSINPASYRQNIVFTATVNSVLGAPAGSVNFYDGLTLLGNATLSGGTAPFSTSRLAVGTHAITASYVGNNDFQISTSPVLSQFVGYVTRIAVTTSGSPSTVNQPTTFSATVTSTFGAIPNGDTVTFYDGTVELGTGLTAAGVATLTTSALSAKTHTIKATYAGDATFKTSSGSVVQVVDPYVTTTTLSSSPNPSNVGETFQLTTVVSNSSGLNIPTHQVKFLNGGTVLGISTLDSTGTATLSISRVSVGSYSVTAEYEGDPENAPSTSSVLTQIVSQAQITMSLSALPNPQAPGKLLKLKATLKSDGSLPNGQKVTFTYGTTTLGTANIAAGAAVFSTSTLPQGSDVVTATYAGNSDFSGASANAQILVAIVLQSISVTPSSASLPAGQTLQYTATGYFNNGTHQDLTDVATWSAGPPTVVTINPSSGVATSVAPGTGTVLASVGALSSPPVMLKVAPASNFLIYQGYTVLGASAFVVDAIVPGTGQLRAISMSLANSGNYQVLPNGQNLALKSGSSLENYSISPAGVITHTGTDVSNPNWNSGPFVDPLGRFLYMADNVDSEIWTIPLDSSGNFGPPAVALSGVTTGTIAIDPAGAYLYAQTANNTISSYKIGASGTLTAIGSVPGPSYISFLLASPSGNALYALSGAAFANSSIFPFSISQGVLTPLTPLSVPSTDVPAAMAIDPSGRYLYFTEQGSEYEMPDGLFGFAIAPNGSLTAMQSGASFAVGENPVNVTVDAAGQFAYVNNSLSSDIWVYSIASGTGLLTKVGEITSQEFFGQQEIVSGAPVTFIPTGLYVTNATTNGTITQFAIDPATGKLSNLSAPIAAGDDPRSIASDPFGQYAYAGAFGQGADSLFGYSISNLGLTPLNGSPFASGNQPSAMTTDLSGSVLYATMAGPTDNDVWLYDLVSGVPTNGRAVVDTDSQPVFITGEPSGRLIFVANYLGKSIDTYEIQPSGGATLTLNASLPVGQSQNWIAVHPSGLYAYSADPVANAVWEYTIGGGKLALNSTPYEPAGADSPGANSVVVEPTGRYLYAINQSQGQIFAFSINPSTGLLSKVKHSAPPPPQSNPFPNGEVADPGPSPSALAVDISGKYLYCLYTPSTGSGAIAVYSIDLSTGFLTSLQAVSNIPYAAGLMLTGTAQYGSVVPLADRYPTRTALSSGPNPSYAGEPVQLTAVVSDTSGSNIPTGLVEFLVSFPSNGTTSLGTATLDATGTATLTTTALPVGISELTAEYEGDLENGVSTSSPLNQIVNAATLVSISVTPSRASTAIGQTLQYVAIGNFSDGSQSSLPFATWFAAPADVVTINPSTGLATAVGLGTVTVQATFGGVASNSATLTVGLASRYLIHQGQTALGQSAFVVDAVVPGTGQLRARSMSVADPGNFQMLPNGQNAVVLSSSGNLENYSISPAGVLTHTGTDVSNPNWYGGPYYVGPYVDPLGRFIYVADTTDGEIWTIPLDSSGNFGTPAVAVAGVDGLTSIALDPAGAYLYAQTAYNIITIYKIGASGTLTAIAFQGGASAPFAPMVVSPSGNVLYEWFPEPNSIVAYSISQGLLTYLNIFTLPASNLTSPPASMAIDPSGSYLYLVENTSPTAYCSPCVNGLFGFTIAPNGALTPIQSGASFPVGQTPVNVTVDAAGQFAYVNNSSSNDVWVYSIASGTGLLTKVSEITSQSFSGQQAIVPGAPLTFTPTGLYATSATSPGFISSFSIDATTGQLNLDSLSADYDGLITWGPSGNDPQAIATDPFGRYAYVGDGGQGTDTLYAYGAGCGAGLSVPVCYLNVLDGSPFASGNQPSAMTTDLSGSVLYATMAGPTDNDVWLYDLVSGVPTNGRAVVDTDSQPVFITGEPSGRLIFVANYLGKSIDTYEIQPSGGATLTLNASLPVGQSQNWIAVHPSGLYAYSADPVANAVWEYTIGGGKLALNSTPYEPAGADSPGANSVVVEPTGRYLYATNQSQGQIFAFSINPSTGLLSALRTGLPYGEAADPGASPSALAVDISGKYLYCLFTPSTGSGFIAVYSIDLSTGFLTLVQTESNLAGTGIPYAAGFTLTGTVQ